MSARRKGREIALQVLYQLDMSGESPEQGLHAFADSFDVSPNAREFAWQLVRGVRECRGEIDAHIAGVSEHWKLDRLAQIDATVIRIAVYEMLTGLPMEIAIDEALEVARRFGTAESAAFVNGVLDAVAKRLGLERGRQPARTEE